MNALTIARLTIHEAISRRLILGGVIVSVLFLALFAVGFSFLYDRAQEVAARRPNPQLVAVSAALQTLLGLYAVNFLAGLLALFLSAGAVAGEIDAGTLHAVLARPIRRADFIVGRWLAYVGMISAYVGLMAGSLLLLAWTIAGYEPSDAPRSVALMMLGSVLLVSISLFGSTVLSTLTNGVVVFSLFGLAWLAGVVEFLGGVLANQAMVTLGIVVSLLIPSDAVWRGASYYIQSPLALTATSAAGFGMPFASSVPPAVPLVVWAILYPLLFLGVAVLAFSRRDL